MDDRFPKWLRVGLKRLDFLGLPNLGMLIAGLTVLGFIGQTMLGAPIERFVFDPNKVMSGEWWRLFAYPVSEQLSNPIWLLLYVLYIYFVMSSLESQWGPGPGTVFTLFSYLAAIGAGFLSGRPLSVWYHVVENVSLAFGTLFPNLELYLFFILPVKAKWLAFLAGGVLLLQFVLGDLTTKLFLVVVMAPYLVFFGPMLVRNIRDMWKRRGRRKRLDDDMWR